MISLLLTGSRTQYKEDVTWRTTLMHANWIFFLFCFSYLVCRNS